MRGFLLAAIVALLLVVAVRKSFVCPLAKQGCDCGRICNRNFDCVRGSRK